MESSPPLQGSLRVRPRRSWARCGPPRARHATGTRSRSSTVRTGRVFREEPRARTAPGTAANCARPGARPGARPPALRSLTRRYNALH